jgi:hypothetical protein
MYFNDRSIYKESGTGKHNKGTSCGYTSNQCDSTYRVVRTTSTWYAMTTHHYRDKKDKEN